MGQHIQRSVSRTVSHGRKAADHPLQTILATFLVQRIQTTLFAPEDTPVDRFRACSRGTLRACALMLPSFCEVVVREERAGNGFVVEGWCKGDNKKVWPFDSEK